MNRTMCVSTAVREMQSQIKKCALNAVKKTLKNAGKDITGIEKTKSKELLKEKGYSGNNETKKDYVQSAESVLSIMERKCAGAAETSIRSKIKAEVKSKGEFRKS